MATSLILQLNANAHLTPDQIANLIGDPFSRWAQGGIMSQSLFESKLGTRIVLCHFSYRTNPARDAETHHQIGDSDPGRYICGWDLRTFEDGILREGGMFWFRSLSSFEANRNETF